MPEIQSPFPDSLPFKEVVEALADDDLASIHKKLPDTQGHPYDTTLSAEKPHDDVHTFDAPNTLDIRTRFERQPGTKIPDVPRDTVLRGTIQLYVPSHEHYVHGMVNTHTRNTDDASYGPYGSIEHLMYIPLDAHNRLHTIDLKELQHMAGKLGLLRLIADIHIPTDVQAGGIIESVYAIQRPFDDTRDPEELYASMYPHILEGTIADIDPERDIRVDPFPSKLRREFVVQNDKGAHTVAMVNPTRYAGSMATFFESPQPATPLKGDIVQAQVYSQNNGTLRNAPHRIVPTMDVRNGRAPIMSLTGTTEGSERWLISHKSKFSFEAAFAQVENTLKDPEGEPLDPAKFREAYGQLLLRHIGKDGSFTFTASEREALEALQKKFKKLALEAHVEDEDDDGIYDPEPLGFRLSSVDADYVAATYGRNIFAMTEEEYEGFLDDVIDGTIPALDVGKRLQNPHSGEHPFLLGLRSLDDESFAKSVCEKILTITLPEIVTTVSTPGEYKLLNDAIRLIPNLPKPETLMNSLFDAAYLLYRPENRYSAEQCWVSMAATLRSLLNDSIELTYPYPLDSDGSQKSFCLESIERIRNPEVITAFLKRFPQVRAMTLDSPRFENIPSYYRDDLEQIQQKLPVIAAFLQRQQRRQQHKK